MTSVHLLLLLLYDDELVVPRLVCVHIRGIVAEFGVIMLIQQRYARVGANPYSFFAARAWYTCTKSMGCTQHDEVVTFSRDNNLGQGPREIYLAVCKSTGVVYAFKFGPPPAEIRPG